MLPETVLAAASFVLGACIGSFLNVCIYRMPLGISVNDPKRSFCPSCKYQIPWYRNLPLISWLALRGKCAQCGARISVRYFAVELLVAALFLGLWLKYEPLLAVWMWALAALLVAATFIDFDHMIIPDEITLGGTALGLVGAAVTPSLMGQETWSAGLAMSAAGAGLGFTLLWSVSVLGKAAFGRKTLRFDPPAAFRWKREEDRAQFEVNGEDGPWEEWFTSEKDVLVIGVDRWALDGVEQDGDEIRTRYERMERKAGEVDLNGVSEFSGVARWIAFTRDAMGFGDVKFIACIGAFLGWQAVLFTVVAASISGALFGVGAMVLGHREWSSKIPFGPYLALGALLWMFCGPAIVEWYAGLLVPQEPAFLN